MKNSPTDDVEQHPQDTIAFRNSKQATDETYAYLREIVIGHVRDESREEFVEHVDLSQTQLRRVIVEDGVLSYDATHPHVTHESEMDGEIDFEEVSVDDD